MRGEGSAIGTKIRTTSDMLGLVVALPMLRVLVPLTLAVVHVESMIDI
jgi:hypothetical protein